MSTPRQRIEATLGTEDAFGFLDLAPSETADTIARCAEERIQAEHDAIATATASALPRLPGWMRGVVRSALGASS